MTPRQTLRAAIRQYRSDDLERAQFAFYGLKPAQMAEQFGESGKTRAEILAEYQQHARNCTEALEWLERQKD